MNEIENRKLDKNEMITVEKESITWDEITQGSCVFFYEYQYKPVKISCIQHVMQKR